VIRIKLAKHLTSKMNMAEHRDLPFMTASQLHVTGVGTEGVEEVW